MITPLSTVALGMRKPGAGPLLDLRWRTPVGGRSAMGPPPTSPATRCVQSFVARAGSFNPETVQVVGSKAWPLSTAAPPAPRLFGTATAA